MTSVTISKIQLRRGLASDLPGVPTSLSPLTFSAGLDEGELGYTTDSGRLFIGIGADVPNVSMPNFERAVFPYQNIEVLTENTPSNVVFGEAFADNQVAYILSAPLAQTANFQNLQVTNPSTGAAQDFYLDIPGVGVNAWITYFLYTSSHYPIRQGRLSVIWNTNFVTGPLCSDEAQTAVSGYANIQFQATLVGSSANQHVVLQYINQTGDTPSLLFRIDRPSYSSSTSSSALNAPVSPYLSYAQMPPEVQFTPAQVFIAGLASAVHNCLTVSVALATTVPANFASSTGYSGTLATGTVIFTVSYTHNNVSTTIGTITFTSASSAPTFSTQAAVSLVAGDVLSIVTTTSDATLANVAITLMLLKQ